VAALAACGILADASKWFLVAAPAACGVLAGGSERANAGTITTGVAVNKVGTGAHEVGTSCVLA